jgi:hypothetical protein
MRGVLKSNLESKIYADGRTYDGKLYTFKECDYNEVWSSLDVMAKRLSSTSVQNIPAFKADSDEELSANDIGVLNSQSKPKEAPPYDYCGLF